MLCSLCQFDNPAPSERCRACGAALGVRANLDNAPDALPDGTLLAGTYAVESVLGQGGFGITYLCHDRMLDRRVAVKEFFPSGCHRQNAQVQPSRGLSEANYREARAQFLAEARTLARCHHPGIVGVHAAFEANDTAYMVMELLHGKSLAQLLTARGGRLDEAEAVGTIERIGAALQFVHDLDLLHRDIKPDNIIACDDGRVMLIDFGTARQYIKGQAQGQTVVVTPGYAPLEQYARQARRGAFTDVYGLSATLYHLLTGQMPPAASDRAMGVALRPVREENPRISRSVAHAVESGLQMEIAKRPQSVREFLDLMKAPVEDAQLNPLPLTANAEEENGALWAPRPNPLATGLFADAVRARQQMLDGLLPADPQPVQLALPTDPQPVKLAPPQAFSASAAVSNAAPSATTVAHLSGAGGNVGVKSAPKPNRSANLSWWLFAMIVGGFGLAALVRPRRAEKFYQPPPISSSIYQPGLPPGIRSVPSDNFASRPAVSQYAIKRDAARREAGQRAWDALPVLLPASIQTLPDSGEPKSKSASDSKGQISVWRGAVEFSPDGKRLAYIDNQSVLRVLSLPDRQIVRSLALDRSRTAASILFSADNQTFGVIQMGKKAGSDQYETAKGVEVWSVRTGERLGTFTTGPQEDSVRPKAILNDGQVLLRTTSRHSSKADFFLWNPKTGKRDKTPLANIAGWSHSVVSPDGREFVVGSGVGGLRWLDLQTGAQKAERALKLTEADYGARFGINTRYYPDNGARIRLSAAPQELLCSRELGDGLKQWTVVVRTESLLNFQRR